MPMYDKQKLFLQAKELGFIRDTFEKTYRLAGILKFFGSDSLLSNVLALKGGTAINLTIFNLPRLSVDIDLDYSGRLDRDAMLMERADITRRISQYMTNEGYEQSGKSKFYHALDSFVFMYSNSGGVRDNIKIEVNYSLRCHVLPLERRSIETLRIFEPTAVLALAPIEIFASKIVALLTRTAARDLYDVNNMVYFDLFGETEKELLRKCVVFYSAIAADTNLKAINLDIINSVTYHRIRTDLMPVIRKKEHFELSAAQERVRNYLTELLILTESEHQFLVSFYNKEYRPELLFDDIYLGRIQNHPMAIWRMRQSQINET